MHRSPLALAALASSAVSGLNPVQVQGLPSGPGSSFDIAFVTDTEDRQWVIRAPRSDAAGAQMDMALSMLTMLMRRVSFAVPSPRGFVALKEGGRAVVYPRLPGRTLDFDNLPAGPGVAADLGRTIAALHNVDHRLFEEAGVPVYDADACRTRRLADLDRAATTGLVPTGLLTRWERQLEDVTQWQFAATPVHGDLTGDQVLAVFEDEDDASTGKVRGLLGWEDAKVGDPAEDFMALVEQAPEDGLETVLEAYAHTRAERPDPQLVSRARLIAQMSRLALLNTALALGHRDEVDRHAVALRRLDEHLHGEDQSRYAARAAAVAVEREADEAARRVRAEREKAERETAERLAAEREASEREAAQLAAAERFLDDPTVEVLPGSLALPPAFPDTSVSEDLTAADVTEMDVTAADDGEHTVEIAPEDLAAALAARDADVMDVDDESAAEADSVDEDASEVRAQQHPPVGEPSVDLFEFDGEDVDGGQASGDESDSAESDGDGSDGHRPETEGHRGDRQDS